MEFYLIVSINSITKLDGPPHLVGWSDCVGLRTKKCCNIVYYPGIVSCSGGVSEMVERKFRSNGAKLVDTSVYILSIRFCKWRKKTLSLLLSIPF